MFITRFFFRLKLCYFLNVNGYQQQSSIYLKSTFFYHVQNISCLPNNQPFLINPNPFVISYNGFYLAYNFVEKQLDTMVNIAEKAYCLPLQLYKINGEVKLVCIHNGIIFELHYGDEAFFKLALLSDTYTEKNVKLSFADYRIFIHKHNLEEYICIFPDGRILSTTKQNEWESFTLISMVFPKPTQIIQ